MGPTEALARFAVEMDGEALAPDVRHAAWRALLDCLGVALAGSVEDVGRIITEQALSQGGEPEAVIWGNGARTSAQHAALANGTAAHALDYDDTNNSIPGHPSVPVLPAALAMGERVGASGAAVLAAFVAGVEAECKLGLYTGQDWYDLGWHPTSVTGVVGAAVAAGRLARLDVDQMRQAIGLAVAQASGIRQNFGTMAKPFHVGRAAQAGVLAVELVRRDFSASSIVLEGPAGFWDVFGHAPGRDPDTFADSLGNPFDLLSPGINFKAYPCCASTHPGIDAALACAGGLTEPDVRSAVVDVPYTAPLILIHHRPAMPLEARFSLEYTVAAALLDGAVTLTHFNPDAVARPDLQALLRRIDYRVPDEWRKGAGELNMGQARIEVRLADGSVRRAQVAAPRGSAANPLSDAQLEAKFLDCAALALGTGGARRALDLVRDLESLTDVRGLAAALAAPAAAARSPG